MSAEAGGGTLVLGYGNPGRRDDGLGPALAEEVAGLEYPGVHVQVSYQLAPEDALTVSRVDRVIFVDASVDSGPPFRFRPVTPGAHQFSTHRLSPEAVVRLARDLYGSQPEAWVLEIRGYDFERVEERLTSDARANLAAAREFLHTRLR